MTRDELIDTALAVAAKYPVFPCNANKQPVVKGGFKSASRDPVEVRRLFSLPGATLIGVPTGHVSGLYCLDVDPDGKEWLETVRERLPPTRTQSTRRGLHFLFKMPARDISISQDLVAPGVDVRANGGYIIWWRAEALDVTNHETLADLPDWLADASIPSHVAVTTSSTAPTVDPFANLKARTDITLEQAVPLLQWNDYESYGSWTQAGMALQHQFGEDGFPLWVEWSLNSDKFPGEDECRRKWDTFGQQSGPPVTMRAVIAAAKRAGAPPELWGGAAPKTTAVADAVAALTSVPAAERRRFRLFPAVEYANQKPPGWIVKDVVPKADLGLVYAASGAGKTFWITDLALHMAAGDKPYRGKHAVRGAQRVAYICAEGSRGFSVRLRAMSQHLGINLADVAFDVMPDVPSFLDPEQVAAVIAQLTEGNRKYDIIVVDTLAQCTAGGDENSAEDMGLALTHCRALCEALGAMVILVHHAGKDATKGARGWSGLRAAVDFEVEIVREGDRRSARLSKQKDAADGGELFFTLVPHPLLGVSDEDGNEAASCHVRHDEPPAEKVGNTVRGLPKGKVERVILNTAGSMCVALDSKGKLPYVQLVEAVMAAMPRDEGGRDRRRELINRALISLTADGFLTVDDKVVTLL